MIFHTFDNSRLDYSVIYQAAINDQTTFMSLEGKFYICTLPLLLA